MNQKINHSSPTAPVRINAILHPQTIIIAGTTIGATIAPIFVPELKIPVANALSFLGNHSATVFMAAGKFPDSETPRNPLQNPKPKTPLASAWPGISSSSIDQVTPLLQKYLNE